MLYNIKCRTRAKYHYSLKSLKKNKETVIANKVANYMLQNKSKDFWNEIKKAKCSTRKTPSTVDSAVGCDKICDVFCNKYKNLYNSVSYDVNDMKGRIDTSTHEQCHKGKCYSNHQVSVNNVISSVKHLKCGKHDGDLGYVSYHIVTASKKYYLILSLLFKTILTHSCVPSGLLLSTVIPIPKHKNKSLGDSDNYRGIALSSILGKLFDIILLKNNKE